MAQLLPEKKNIYISVSKTLDKEIKIQKDFTKPPTQNTVTTKKNNFS